MIVEYTLTRANAIRKPHVGLVVNAYYKREPLDQNESEVHITFFHRWPKVKIRLERGNVTVGTWVKRQD